jgi:hypothetical protein
MKKGVAINFNYSIVPFFTFLLAACGNWGCNDCDEPAVFFRYSNPTAYTLVMKHFENGILRGDSLVIGSNDSLEISGDWLNRSEFQGTEYQLRFASDPESCLVFRGTIQNRDLDIRIGTYVELDSLVQSKRKLVYRMVLGERHLKFASPCSTQG